MTESDFEGTLVLEKLTQIGRRDDFFDAIDDDNFKVVASLMRAAKIDDQTIAMVLKKMENS